MPVLNAAAPATNKDATTRKLIDVDTKWIDGMSSERPNTWTENTAAGIAASAASSCILQLSLLQLWRKDS